MVTDVPIVYRPAVPTEKCYLAEVLLWHAFGRFPEEMRLPGMAKDWRFSEEVCEDFEAPHPGRFILSPDECSFAGIPPDPLGHARAHGVELRRPEDYPGLLHMMEVLKGKDTQGYKILEYDFELSKELHRNFEDWQRAYNSYSDQFAAEILLELRRGNIKAWGSKLPFAERKSVLKYLSFKEIGLSDLEIVEIPRDQWVTTSVNWEESSLSNGKQAFIWIHLLSSEVLAAFPPRRKLQGPTAGILPPGATFAAAPVVPEASPANLRGRPPFPWEPFHVEVARLFRDHEVPEKMEAAIAHFIAWFKADLGEDVSRASISKRLKIYYDELVRKKTEN